MTVAASRSGTSAILAAFALASAGCRVVAELIERDEAPRPDSSIAEPSCDSWAFTPAMIDPCMAQPPTAALVIGDGMWTYDTNSGSLTDPAQDVTFPTSELVVSEAGVEVRVVSVERVDVPASATLYLRGKRPLAILSWSTANIDGVVDATSRPGVPAAGADPALCSAAPASAGAVDIEGGGGGGGGSFGATGAQGGTGNEGLAKAGTAGGTATAPPLTLRGGCAGAAGGNTLAGAGGAGGGAILIAARDLVQVNGMIRAGGSGGGAAQGGRSGGGGGGSGGHIRLASTSIVLGATAVVAANGGGGGGGSDGSPALDGRDGQPSSTPAAPGMGQGMGGDGGAGAALGHAAVAGGNARRGGGGGGGGVGVIAIEGADVRIAGSAVVSPAPPP